MLFSVNVAWAYVFYNIWRYRTFTVQELNIYVLSGELVMFALLISFAVFSLVKAIKALREGRL